jgi:hypothetical protein
VEHSNGNLGVGVFYRGRLAVIKDSGFLLEAWSNTSTVTLRVVEGDSKIWSRVPWDSNPRITALARASSNSKQQTRPLVRESAPHQQTRNCLTVIKISP